MNPPSTAKETAARDRVPIREKMALGAGSFAAFFGFVGVNTLAFPVYQMTYGVNALLLGFALMIPRIWDAFTDPFMGKISDNFRSRFGRRRPFIMVGSLLMGITFGLIWMVPAGWSDGAKLVYFVLLVILFFTFYTIFSVPFYSLTYEMTPDYHERTRVMAYTAFFHKLGEFIYQWSIPFAALAIWGSLIGGIRVTGWVIGLIILAACGFLPGLLVKERFAEKLNEQHKVRLLPSIRDAFANIAFVVLVLVIIFNTLSGVLAMGIDHYILVYYMADGDIAMGSVWKGLLSSGYAVVGFVFIPIITWVSGKIGKSKTLYLVYTLMVVGGIMKWFIFTPGNPIIPVNLGFATLLIDPIILIDPLLCGPMWVAVKILLASMMADICDDDELRHGDRREGMFGAVFSWTEKTAISLAFLGTGLALQLSGFDQALGGEQSERTFTLMRLFLAGAPAITALMAIVALYFYPIDARRAEQTRQTLESRRPAIRGAMD